MLNKYDANLSGIFEITSKKEKGNALVMHVHVKYFKTKLHKVFPKGWEGNVQTSCCIFYVWLMHEGCVLSTC